MTPSPLDRLATVVANCAASGVARQAMLLRLDRLPTPLSRPHHQRLVEAALAPLLDRPRAELFRLPGARLAVTWRGEAEDAVLDAVDALDHLLADTAEPAPSLRDLVFLFDLPSNGDLLLAALHDDPPPPPPPLPPRPPIDPASLILLETTLAQANIARFARRQPVWRLGRNSTPEPEWEKRTICVAELGAELLPGCDLAGDPWLFRRLTRTLDKRMLSLLASPGELAVAGSFMLDLNVSSVLGVEFLRFDAALPAALRGRVALALAPGDLASDAAAFAFARGFARARGYPTVLRDATPGLLAVLPPAACATDYFILPWAADLPGASGLLFDCCDPDQLVLDCGGEPEALAWGAGNGLQLFTGAAADRAAGSNALGERAGAA